jgi:hypothetical protein
LITNTVLEAPGRLERRLAELAEDAGMVDRRAGVVWINIQRSWCCAVGGGVSGWRVRIRWDESWRGYVKRSEGSSRAGGKTGEEWHSLGEEGEEEDSGRGRERTGGGKGKGKAGDGKEGRRDKRMGHSEPYFVVFISSRRRRDEGWTVRRYGCTAVYGLYVWYGTVLLLTNYTL